MSMEPMRLQNAALVQGTYLFFTYADDYTLFLAIYASPSCLKVSFDGVSKADT